MRPIKQQAKKIGDLGVIALAFVIPSCLWSLDIAVLALIGVSRIVQGDPGSRKIFLKQPRVLLPILFYLYMAAGFFFAHNFKEALSTISEKLPYLLYPLIIGSQASLDKDLMRKAGRAFVLSLVTCLAIALLYAAGDMLITHANTIMIGETLYKKWSWYGLTRIYDNWHPSYVSAFCSLAIAFILYTPYKKQVYTIAAFIFLSACVFLLYSITGIINYFLVLLFFGYRWLRRRRSATVSLGLGLTLVGMLAGFLYFNPFNFEKLRKLKEKGLTPTDQQDQRTVLTIRMAKWTTHLDIFKTHALLGTTAGDIKDIRKQAYIEKGYTDLAQYNYNAHDQYIEMLATYGIVGSLIFLSMLVAAFPRRQCNPMLAPFLLIALVAFTTESILERQQGLHFFMFFYSLLTLRVSGKSS